MSKVGTVQAQASLNRAKTAFVLVLTEMVVLIGILVGLSMGSALAVVSFGFILLGAILVRIEIAIANVGYEISKTLHEPN
ncbi:MAG: hypothetical protein Q8R55_07045 [Candidatus Taylorbacteria bacterium]|nr:hypothetical protein [Candidatus Taylorbacteria bacterium]